jgi:hypothetical protein
MRRGRPFPYWVAVLTVGLLGLLSPLAHTCTADPRWLVSSADDLDLNDQLLLAADGVLATVLAIPPVPRGTPHLIPELAAFASTVAGSASCTRAPPVLLARSV